MALYDALIAKWATLSGTTGVKLAAVNALTVTVTLPAKISATDVRNAINSTDFLTLTSLQIQQMTFLLQGSGTVDASVGTNVRSVFASIFAGKPTTLNALTALVSPYDNHVIPWWQATVAQGGGGLSGPVTDNDLIAAGLS